VLPSAGRTGGPKLGLGLWNFVGVTMKIELMMYAVGVWTQALPSPVAAIWTAGLAGGGLITISGLVGRRAS
jgi:hypothetical protein